MLNIALIVSELFPYAQTGGLGQMAASLGEALQALGARPHFFLPKYAEINILHFKALAPAVNIPLGPTAYPARFLRGRTESGIPVFLLDLPEFFHRKGLYGEGGADFPDNAARFIAFSRGCLEGLKALNLKMDVLHVHDWQTALVPIFLRTHYAGDPFYSNLGSLLTIHNLSYQGIFPPDQFPLTGLDWKYFRMELLEFFGNMNFLKGGIVAADYLTTVSPSYAGEILSPEFGCGLDTVLARRKDRLRGVLNGIDDKLWNPETDALLHRRYGSNSLKDKNQNKMALQREMGLEARAEIPLMAMVTRLVDQKGIDWVEALVPHLAQHKIQLAVLGSGTGETESRLEALSAKFRKTFSLALGFDVALSHRMTAGADFMLVPSRFEPCGYNQLFGQRYGTVPIVRQTGGLKDSVTDYTQNPGQGTGFCFKATTADALWEAIQRAVRVFKNRPLFREIQKRGMARDFSWTRSAQVYLELYQKAREQISTGKILSPP